MDRLYYNKAILEPDGSIIPSLWICYGYFGTINGRNMDIFGPDGSIYGHYSTILVPVAHIYGHRTG